MNEERDDDELHRRRNFQPPERNSIAAAALVLGVLALCGGITAIPGLICGILGMSRAGSRGGTGHGMALAGVILSVIGLLTAAPLLIALLLPAVQKVREASMRMQTTNNLKQIGRAQELHESVTNSFAGPDYYRGPAGGKPASPSDRLGWRVAILPYLEQDSLHNSFDLAAPWNSPVNLPLSDTMIKPYVDASEPVDPAVKAQSPAMTRYRVFYGGGAAFDLDRPTDIRSIPDGTSNTICVVEGGYKVTWSRFDEYPFSMNGPLPLLGKPNGTAFQAALFDGSVRTIRTSIDPKVLKSGIHASDGLPLGE
jgi:hypothetical protein